MGESKQRKETDPNYGKFRSKLRGLIVSPPIQIDGNTIHIKQSNLDTQELRSSLLYWDRLALPTTSAIYIGGGKDEEHLESCGILRRNKLHLDGNGSDILISAQALTLQQFESETPGMWSLGGGKNSLLIKGNMATQNSGSLLQLLNALPVPKEDTPLAEILEFKRKRRPELLALREYIEQLSMEISSSADSVDSLNEKLRLLDVACSDLLITTREYQLPFYLSNLSASLNFDYKNLAVAASTWASTELLGLNLTSKTLATFAATAGSMISLKSDIKFRSINRPASPFKYAYHIQRDLG